MSDLAQGSAFVINQNAKMKPFKRKREVSSDSARTASMDEQELLQLLKTDPHAAMVPMMERYTGLLWHVISLHLSDPEDVRECVNDTFAEFYFGRERFDPKKASLAIYLSAIGRHLAVSKYRQDFAQEIGGSAVIQDASASVRAKCLEDVEEACADAELNAAELRVDLEKAFAALKPDELALIQMKFYEGMSVQQMADALNLPYEIVKKRHQRTMGKLKRVMLAMLVFLLVFMAACGVLRELVRNEIVPDMFHLDRIWPVLGILNDDGEEDADSVEEAPVDDSRVQMTTESADSETTVTAESADDGIAVAEEGNLAAAPADAWNLGTTILNMQNDTGSLYSSPEETAQIIADITQYLPSRGIVFVGESSVLTLKETQTVDTDDWTFSVTDAQLRGNTLAVQTSLETKNLFIMSENWHNYVGETGTILLRCGDLELHCNSGVYEHISEYVENTTWYFELPETFDAAEADGMTVVYLGQEYPISLVEAESDTVPDNSVGVTGEYGGVLAVPRLEDGHLIVAIYPVSRGEEYATLPGLIRSATGKTLGEITATAEDGTVLTGSAIRYSPMSDASYYEWDFGEAEAGSYTLHIPFLCQKATYQAVEIPLDLTTLSWSDEAYAVTGGTLRVTGVTQTESESEYEDVKEIDGVTNSKVILNELYSGYEITLAFEGNDSAHTLAEICLADYAESSVLSEDEQARYDSMIQEYLAEKEEMGYENDELTVSDGKIVYSWTLSYGGIVMNEETQTVTAHMLFNTMNYDLSTLTFSTKEYNISNGADLTLKWNQSFDLTFAVSEE